MVKGKYFSTLERQHICKINKDRLHMKETYIGTSNPTFETLHQTAAPPVPYMKQNQFHNTLIASSLHT
jgi:hypothetical protein